MSLFGIFALGFIAGAVVVGLAFCVVLWRYKFENGRMSRAIDSMEAQQRQLDKFRAKLMRTLLDSNAALELARQEIEKLRDEKLDAWDVPGEM